MRNLDKLKLFGLTFLLCLGITASTMAQTREVSGVVISGEDNFPLPGVSILVKGTTTGTVTDVDGNFNITVNSDNPVLVFSFIGFMTQEVEVGARTTLDITLAPDTKSLEEVVVVGYGEQKKETITGSVATVKGKELTKSPALNLSNSIAGRMAGVVAVNRSGEPGYDDSGIRIRGSNTLGNNDALVVIDGIPARAGGLSRLNPNDIESISVLKDASAAIYGSRAANGVILVTTKRGTTGKPELTFQMNQGWAQPTVIPKLADAAQYAEMLNDLDIYALPVDEWGAANDAYKQSGVYTRPDGQVRNAPYTPDELELYKNGSDPWFYPNTDWYGETLKTWSPQSRYNLQLVGGSENVKYLTSLGYQNQDAYYKNAATGYKQYDFRINLDANINEYVKVGLGILAREEFRFFPTRGAGAIFRMQMRGKPNQPAYWPNGLPGPDIENGENPVVITTNATGYNRDKRDYIQTTGNLEIKIPGVEGLKFTGTAAIDKYIRYTKNWQIPWTLYELGNGYEADGVTPVLVGNQRGPAEPNLSEYTSQQLNILLGGVFNYDKKINEDHTINVVAGVNRETIEGNDFNAYRRFFISTAIDQMFAGGDLQKDNGGGAFNRARLNYFGRVAYNYKEKYLAEFLWRYDGSYIFPEDTRFGFFPGVMLGWVASEEGFWKNSGIGQTFDFFKVRGSWGQLGNDQIGEFQYLSTYGFSSYIVGGAETKTLYETRIPNRAITWEVANNSNLGFEGQFLQGKIFFEFDLFYNKRTNILWQRNASIPQSTGLSLPAENIGEVENKGFDLNLGYRGGKGEFQYSVSVNGGYAKNQILFWDESPGAPEWQQSTGSPMNTFLVYQYDGVFRDQQEIDAETLDYSAVTGNLRPGDMRYKDYDGDGKITPDDRVRMDQNNIPTFQGGLNFNANWKGFDFSLLLQGALGARQYVSAGESGNIGNYLLDFYENRWTIDNPSSTDPRIANRSDQWYSGGNTYWFRKTDYLRLKNLEIGYNLPAHLTQKVGIQNARFYVNGLNLITFDKLKVYDPEGSSSTGQYYPQARVINTGLSVSF
ncbi:TonB-linked SusC/RagA family outer membrane protein [Algoriphagus zhangzhouensis]|uniref:TonB-linked outer membrane protein, SusC/RagA family n=2 Tax=Algoriphagus zhangzhouensis TaxID=1073327 RepID=A0A1M7ZAP7_9BACT|nr:TonB-dependent receptor [Algoriphagus zhangzhouensis]TDY47077.1 TonB-linked SusC/RagA family outer membrane protein [Algoriphagus zhangzhouensis]SHO61964.1 TonB-linked outer membrane protein, SusC/RagA family [Algoriphagus zhangzhouensis]